MSCCGCLFRVLALVLLLCFTACIVLSNFLALFRSTDTFTSDAKAQSIVTYWYQQVKLIEDAEVTMKLRTYTNELQCSEERRMFIAMCALSVAACALGALASLFTIVWMLPCCRCAMGAMVFVFTLLAGLCCAAVFGMLTWGFFHGYCQYSPVVSQAAYADSGYKMVEGYVLLCVAGLGFLLMALLEAIAFCCCCCCASCSSSSSAAKNKKEEKSESRTEPMHVEEGKEAPAYYRSTGDNTPYANKWA